MIAAMEAPEESLRDEALDRALAWHFSAPIRVDDPRSPAHGALLHGFDRRRREPLGVYTEITGYAISLSLFLLRRRGESRFLTTARQAADYLMRIQTPEGAYPHLSDPAAGPARLFAFDTAMCLVGMARLARIAGEKRYADSAVAAGDWLVGMQRSDGSFHSMALRDGGLKDPGGFHGDGSCIHAKNAIALLELHALSGQEGLREAARRACAYALTLQDADGAFWSTPTSREVVTHAHCYACEGLLFAGSRLGEARLLAAARSGVQWLARHQRGDGGWLSQYKATVSTPRAVAEALRRARPSDAAAQAARLLRLHGEGHDQRRKSALRFLRGCQDGGGGFFHRRSRWGHGPHLYTWCAQFAIQALVWDSSPAEVADLF